MGGLVGLIGGFALAHYLGHLVEHSLCPQIIALVVCPLSILTICTVSELIFGFTGKILGYATGVGIFKFCNDEPKKKVNPCKDTDSYDQYTQR